LVEMLVVAVCAMLWGAGNLVEIHTWAEERLDWLRRFMKLEHGIASHDAIGQVFGMLDARAVESCFRRWVSGRIPVLEPGTVVAVDGKTRRRSGSEACRPLHLVSALAVKDNHPKLAESIRDFFATGKANHWANVHHDDYATVEKDHGRVEVRRYCAFGHLDSLSHPGLHWCLDVCLNDDQARAPVKNSAQNLATVRRMALNILWLEKSRKGGIKTRRLVASTSDSYRVRLLGLVAI